MKVLKIKFAAFGAILFLFCSNALADFDRFVGVWTNLDSANTQFTVLQINGAGAGKLDVQTVGSGGISGFVRASGLNPSSGGFPYPRLLAQYNDSDRLVSIDLERFCSVLTARIRTDFHDARPSTVSIERFARLPTTGLNEDYSNNIGVEGFWRPGVPNPLGLEGIRIRKLSAGFIVGEYGDTGILVGKQDNDCATGVLIDQGEVGYFHLEAKTSILTARFQFRDAEPIQMWAYNMQSQMPLAEFQNFSRQGISFKAEDTEAEQFSGTYSSNFGPLLIHAEDGLLLGDYGQRGIVAGILDENGVYQGVFTNARRAGWFEWNLDDSPLRLVGGDWGWFDQSSSGDWNLTLEDVFAFEPSEEGPDLVQILRDLSL